MNEDRLYRIITDLEAQIKALAESSDDNVVRTARALNKLLWELRRTVNPNVG